jgi:hypothetical protein
MFSKHHYLHTFQTNMQPGRRIERAPSGPNQAETTAKHRVLKIALLKCSQKTMVLHQYNVETSFFAVLSCASINVAMHPAKRIAIPGVVLRRGALQMALPQPEPKSSPFTPPFN